MGVAATVLGLTARRRHAKLGPDNLRDVSPVDEVPAPIAAKGFYEKQSATAICLIPVRLDPSRWCGLASPTITRVREPSDSSHRQTG
jgi:hypothetical protein